VRVWSVRQSLSPSGHCAFLFIGRTTVAHRSRSYCVVVVIDITFNGFVGGALTATAAARVIRIRQLSSVAYRSLKVSTSGSSASDYMNSD